MHPVPVVAQKGIVLCGLGTGDPDLLTLEAHRLLTGARELAIFTEDEPALQRVCDAYPHMRVRRLPAGPEAVSTIMERAGESLVLVGVPGNPVDDERASALAGMFGSRGIEIRLVAGVPNVSGPIPSATLPEPDWSQILSSAEIVRRASADALGQSTTGEMLPWRAPTPTVPMIVTDLGTAPDVQRVREWLARYYPLEHVASILRDSATGVSEQHVRLADLPLMENTTGAVLCVPSLSETENVRTFAGLMELTRRLRAPGGCPWDREQTHETLKKHLLEEAYEVIDALDRGDAEALCEELGDLLFQITIHSQIAAENGTFTIEDVLGSVVRKLTGRHPHVFADTQLESSQEVLERWEDFKQKEKPKRSSIFEHIPRELPALPQSNLMQKRAANVGFEWPGLDEVMEKVAEEMAELRAEFQDGSSKEAMREEYGDLLFALVSVGRHLHLDPEEALRLANRKFSARFQYVESRVSAGGHSLRDITPDELDVYWNEAKALGTGPH